MSDYNAIFAENPRLRAMVDSMLVAENSMLVDGPHSLHKLVRDAIGGKTTEHFMVIALTRPGHIIDSEVLSVGNTHQTIVDPSVIFNWLLTREQIPSRFIVAHNHPSGDPNFSAQDREVSRALRMAGELMRIQFVDHLLVAGVTVNSMAACGAMP